MKTLAAIFVLYGVASFAGFRYLANGIPMMRPQLYVAGGAVSLGWLWFAAECWRNRR
jgi:hypothetical protein